PVEVVDLRLQNLLTAEREQLPCESGGALARIADLEQVATFRGVGRHAAERQLTEAKNSRQHVVEIVRDAAGQLANRLHLLRVIELLLELPAFTALRRIAELAIDGWNQARQPSLDEEVLRPRLQRRHGRLLTDGSRDDDERDVRPHRLLDAQ